VTTSPAPALPDALTTTAPPAPAAVRLVHRVESAPVLDRLAAVLATVSRPLDTEPLRSALLGTRTGHALHPVLTDVPIGLWSSMLLLDLRGRRSDRPAAQTLLATGLVSVLPTVATGLAEWRGTSNPERRVGALHAGLNVAAVATYAVSLGLRAGGRHRAGVTAGLLATGVAGAAGYLGGHLATARKTGSRHPAYEHDGVGPTLSRPTGGVL